jgi:signal peptidase II
MSDAPNLTRRRVIAVAFAALIFGVDQWIKGLMLGPLALREIGQIELLPFFDLTWTENYGVSLGLLTANTDTMRWVLVGVTSLISLVVLVWMMRERAWPELLGLSLVLGGALGNIRDRATFGYVIDYADFHIGGFRPFLIFNVADAAITIGVLIILARSLFSREKPKPAATKNGAPENSGPAPES